MDVCVTEVLCLQSACAVGSRFDQYALRDTCLPLITKAVLGTLESDGCMEEHERGNAEKALKLLTFCIQVK